MNNTARGQGKRYAGVLPLFDPVKGVTVVKPPAETSGYWAGAPSAIYDEGTSRFYLYYRIREPRPTRGGECCIAESVNGVDFIPIWQAKKEELASSSMEKASLIKTPEGKYRLYISYVDASDSRWRIDMMEASHPANFDIKNRRETLTASSAKCEAVKDPCVVVVGRMYYMLVVYAVALESLSSDLKDKMHNTADAISTGFVKCGTGLALSRDGINFEWRGPVLLPGEGWDAYAAGISTVLYKTPVFTVFYNGSSAVSENYEEKTGLATSPDLISYDRLTQKKPILTSPHASRSLRYVEGVIVGNEVYYYYEYARMDGSHELRMNKVKR